MDKEKNNDPSVEIKRIFSNIYKHINAIKDVINNYTDAEK